MPRTVVYDELARRSRERALLQSCSALLGWDEQTHLPAGGAEYRGDQMALLAGLAHDRATDPRIGELLAEAQADSSGAEPDDGDAAANLREWARSYHHATRLPRDLVAEAARVTSIAQRAWVEARRASDFAAFRPWLAQVVALKQQEARCLAEGGQPLYDALLDEYEPGASGRDLARVFAELRADLIPLIAAITGSARHGDVPSIAGDYPIDRQRYFGEEVAGAIGFDFTRGRLDETAHPFCTGIGPHDCRITTRYDSRDFADAFFSILHEVGHGLYEQGLDPAHHGTPLGEAVSLGIHESQSRLWENAVGRSRPFWEFWYPAARRTFRDALHGVGLDPFVRAINRVEPSLIRVQADEATYNLHIIVRFELEQALVAGDLAVADLPGAWNEHYRSTIGVDPPDDAQGCLQDIHWSAGLIGYFPTYTIGNLVAAQWVDRARADLGDLDGLLARGEFAPLLGWLRDRVHRHGQRYRAGELVERVTGSAIDHRPFVRALRAKFAPLYDL